MIPDFFSILTPKYTFVYKAIYELLKSKWNHITCWLKTLWWLTMSIITKSKCLSSCPRLQRMWFTHTHTHTHTHTQSASWVASPTALRRLALVTLASCDSSNTPGTFLVQAFCTWCSLCLECSSQIPTQPTSSLHLDLCSNVASREGLSLCTTDLVQPLFPTLSPFSLIFHFTTITFLLTYNIISVRAGNLSGYYPVFRMNSMC